MSDTNVNTFKARIKATKPHFLGKVISHRETIEDGENEHFKSYMTVFIPKLTHRNNKPSVMCHISNGAGSCMFRVKNPHKLRDIFLKLADIVDSDLWYDLFNGTTDISEHLIDSGEILLDTQFIDVGTFKQAIGLTRAETIPVNLEVEK